MNKIIKDVFGRPMYWKRSDFEFTCDGIEYEKDEFNGRCYRLEASTSLRSSTDGALARRRISVKEYETALHKCESELAK